MSEKKLNKEIITALQGCKDAKAVMALAKEKGIELSEGQAGELFAALKNDKLNDEELEKVMGGWRTLAVQGWLAGANGEQERNLATIKPSNS